MFELKNDGYVYISDNGIEYELLEGMSVGTPDRYTSDIIFIMLDNEYLEVDNSVVGYFFCAENFKDNPNDYEQFIKETIDKFEKRNFGIDQIIAAIEDKMKNGYIASGLEVIFGIINENEGYYISKLNGWGSTPITQILAFEGSFEDKDLIAKLDEMNIAYNL